jgi:hypothetical protein
VMTSLGSFQSWWRLLRSRKNMPVQSIVMMIK